MFPQNTKGQPIRRKRILLTLAKKVQVLDSLAAGGTYSSVAQKFHLTDSTVRTIKQAEQSIRHSARYGCDTSNNIMFASRPPCIEMMETKLYQWISEKKNDGIKLSNPEITEMAKKILNEVKTPGDGTNFMGSNTWLLNFKKRFDLNGTTIKCTRQELLNRQAADKFRSELISHIKRQKYLPEQVFNANEDLLFWKRLPIADLKNFYAKLPIFFCCNASGDCMVKPMIVYQNMYPQDVSTETLPVFLRANSRYIIREIEITAWFHQCFLPSVKEYLSSKSLPFKVLLIVDNKAKYDILKKFGNSKVSVVMIPHKTKLVIEPLSNGIFAAFKRYYLRRMLSHLSQQMFLDPTLKLQQSWINFTINDGIEIIKDSIDEISASDINACWKMIWPEIVHEYSTLPNENIEIEDILQVIHEINDLSCYEVQLKDIVSILRSKDTKDTHEKNEETNLQENIINLDDEFGEYNTEDTEDTIQNESESQTVKSTINQMQMEVPPLAMPVENLSQIINTAQALQRLVLKLDPSITRSMHFSDSLEELLKPYKEEQAQLGGFI